MNMHSLPIMKPDDWDKLNDAEKVALGVGYASELAYWRRRFGTGEGDGVLWQGAHKRMIDHLAVIEKANPDIRKKLDFPLYRLLESKQLYTATGMHWTSQMSSCGYVVDFNIRQFAYGFASEYGQGQPGNWQPSEPTICGATVLTASVYDRSNATNQLHRALSQYGTPDRWREHFIISNRSEKVAALQFLGQFTPRKDVSCAVQAAVMGAMSTVSAAPTETYWPYWLTSLSLRRERDRNDTRKVGPVENLAVLEKPA